MGTLENADGEAITSDNLNLGDTLNVGISWDLGNSDRGLNFLTKDCKVVTEGEPEVCFIKDTCKSGLLDTVVAPNVGAGRQDISYTTFALGSRSTAVQQEIVCTMKVCDARVETEGEPG